MGVSLNGGGEDQSMDLRLRELGRTVSPSERVPLAGSQAEREFRPEDHRTWTRAGGPGAALGGAAPT
jgi:hypothetical protein